MQTSEILRPSLSSHSYSADGFPKVISQSDHTHSFIPKFEKNPLQLVYTSTVSLQCLLNLNVFTADLITDDMRVARAFEYVAVLSQWIKHPSL